MLLLSGFNAHSDSKAALDGLSAISESDIREAAIAFFNSSTTPGVEGATISVDTDDRQSTQWRSSLGFNAEFTIKEHILNGFWGLALVGGELDDTILVTADNGDPVQVDVTRQLIGARASIGLSLPFSRYFKLRPYYSLAISELRTNTIVDGLTTVIPPANPDSPLEFNSTAVMLSNVGSIEAAFHRWYGVHKLELAGQFNMIHNQAVSEDNPILDTDSWNQTSQLKGMVSGPTNLVSSGRPWRWLAYASHMNFLTHNKASLGYTGLFEIGTGLEWHLNIKPLDWFGWQSVGIKLGVITSRDVEGINFGLTAR